MNVKTALICTSSMLFLLVLSMVAFAEVPPEIRLTGVRIVDDITPQQEMRAYVYMKNYASHTEDYIRVTFGIPELNVRYRTEPFDLGRNEEGSAFISLVLPPDARPGWYLAMVSVDNNEVHNVAFRYVYIR